MPGNDRITIRLSAKTLQHLIEKGKEYGGAASFARSILDDYVNKKNVDELYQDLSRRATTYMFMTYKLLEMAVLNQFPDGMNIRDAAIECAEEELREFFQSLDKD